MAPAAVKKMLEKVKCSIVSARTFPLAVDPSLGFLDLLEGVAQLIDRPLQLPLIDLEPDLLPSRVRVHVYDRNRQGGGNLTLLKTQPNVNSDIRNPLVLGAQLRLAVPLSGAFGHRPSG